MTSQENKEMSSPKTICNCGLSGCSCLWVHSCHWMRSNHPSCMLVKPVQCKAGQIWLKKLDRTVISSKRSSVIQTYFLKGLLSPSLAPVPQERCSCTPSLCSVLNTLYHHSFVMKGRCLLQTGATRVQTRDQKRCQIRK